MAPNSVHLIYIHGFQGDHTTFQSFPTDLHRYVTACLSSHLNLEIKSSLYPTYKSKKPISFATKNFIGWLSTQPPGPVILLGHSMGGLLAAEAATDLFNTSDRSPGAKPSRIVGVIAFDSPYLGMHPHVVVSGIASLIPKGENGNKRKTEREMNDRHVTMVDEEVTDDEWEAFKKSIDTKLSRTWHSSSSILSSPNHSPSGSADFHAPPPLMDRTLAFVAGHSSDPLVRWVRKHSDEPFSAGTRWIIEHLQFGACVFDVNGLRERYARLVSWQGGKWVNYWTETIPKPKKDGQLHRSSEDIKREKAEEEVLSDYVALLQEGSASSSSLPISDNRPMLTSASSSDIQSISSLGYSSDSDFSQSAPDTPATQAKESPKLHSAHLKAPSQAEKTKSKHKVGRHFIVLPTELRHYKLRGSERWEKVRIDGVDDEVAAHTGLFIRDHNLDYEGFVERVGRKILEWCEDM